MNYPIAALYAALGLLGRLPLAALQALAAPLALLLRVVRSREARVAEANIRISMPGLDAAGREALRRASLSHSSCTALETAAVWTRPAALSLRWIASVEGVEHLDAAEAAGRGVIVAAPHIGNWELFSVYLASRRPLGVVYRPPERPALEPLLLRARAHPGVEPLRAEPAVVRRMLSLLRGGGTLGILPDQRPKAGEGLLAPLFGVPALTMTLLPRLAQKTGASVVFGFAERLPHAAGFRIRLLPAPAALTDPDPLRAATALNQGIEACVRLALPQYQWTYKRYPARDPQGNARYERHVTGQ
jgi:KDO2-lipid IV(A) lauroyltransferase